MIIEIRPPPDGTVDQTFNSNHIKKILKMRDKNLQKSQCSRQKTQRYFSNSGLTQKKTTQKVSKMDLMGS